MKTFLLFGAAFAALVSAVVTPDQPRGDVASQVPQDKDAAAGLQRFVDSCRPGKNHEWLKQLVGKWDMTQRAWMMGPDAKPEESKGTVEYRWLVEGKWLLREAKSSVFGRPCTQTTILGYDNFRKKYVSTKVDSMMTMMVREDGVLDPSQKVLTLYGEVDEPMTGTIGKAVKFVTRITGADSIVEEVHDLTIPEPNTKVIEYALVRAK